MTVDRRLRRTARLTLAELVARARSGEPVSLAELAGAAERMLELHLPDSERRELALRTVRKRHRAELAELLA